MSIIDGFLADVAEVVARETRRSPGVRSPHLARIDAIAQFLVQVLTLVLGRAARHPVVEGGSGGMHQSRSAL